MSPLLLPLHGVGSRRDLPLPFEHLVVGAAVTLAVTFALALWAWRTPRLTTPRGRPLPRLTVVVDHPVVRWGARAVVTATYLWFGWALLAGKDALTNPVFGWVFACLWVGLVPVSLLLGTVWRELHPAWSVGLLVDALRGRTDATASRWGVWPATLGLLGFAWLELIQPGRATLGVLRWFVAAYWLWLLVGVLARGRAWVAEADPFSVFADLVARLSPWQRIDGVLHLVSPLRHAATASVPRGTLGVVSVLLGATAMDSWTGGRGWVVWIQGSDVDPVLAGGGALVLCVVVVVLTLGWSSRWLARHATTRTGVVDDLAATCAPIVAGYALAHYATLLILEGQRTMIMASDPLGRGWNVFGTAEWGVGTWLLTVPATVATAQAVAIVGGHVLGVLLAHERGLVHLPPAQRVRGQIPLLVVMVGYTISGLLLLFSA